jgi:hypothetical protein
MKPFILLCFSIFMLGSLAAQNRFGATNGVTQAEMQNKAFLNFDENSTKYFWAVDMNQFTAPQKSTFQDLVFNSETLIAVSTPDVNNYWYLASFKTIDQDIVTVELNKMMDKARSLTTNSPNKYQ